MISYPETVQLRHIILSVRHRNKCEKELPTLRFIGTVKLHGANAAIGYQKHTEHWCQSRHNIITPEKDNAGFANYIHSLADTFFNEFVIPQSPAIREQYEQGRKIVIYGEWCGGNIQKSIAIYGLPKMFVIFKVRICDEILTTAENLDEDESNSKCSFWLDPTEWSHIRWHEQLIYNIYDFPTYETDINFENPLLSQNKLIEITEAVEQQCPVGNYFNKTGIGEGVVWTEWEKSHGALTFKVKGEKHSVSKVKTLAPVDTEKLSNLNEFCEYACTENRMFQGLDYLRENQLTIEMKNVGIFLSWLVKDIIKEEKDIMETSNIGSKEIWHTITKKARRWYQMQLF